MLEPLSFTKKQGSFRLKFSKLFVFSSRDQSKSRLNENEALGVRLESALESKGDQTLKERVANSKNFKKNEAKILNLILPPKQGDSPPKLISKAKALIKESQYKGYVSPLAPRSLDSLFLIALVCLVYHKFQ